MPSSPALLCLVCGFERGGTTALSEVLRQVPGVEAGFEGGFLLAGDPGSFPAVEPYYGMALRGASYREILAHYYRGARIERLSGAGG